ncbi:hypothetical protein EMCRGX_G000271 [Ephydatia muelleri]
MIACCNPPCSEEEDSYLKKRQEQPQEDDSQSSMAESESEFHFSEDKEDNTAPENHRIYASNDCSEEEGSYMYLMRRQEQPLQDDDQSSMTDSESEFQFSEDKEDNMVPDSQCDSKLPLYPDPFVWNSLQSRFRNDAKLSDVFGGTEYRKLMEPEQFLSKPENITFCLNTDGVAVFKSSTAQIWPIWLQINELPPKMRDNLYHNECSSINPPAILCESMGPIVDYIMLLF